MAEAEREFGARPKAIGLHPGGPRYGVSWCFPVLPGVLLADSHYTLGPLGGRGGVKVVLYYGVGSTGLCTLWCWLS